MKKTLALLLVLLMVTLAACGQESSQETPGATTPETPDATTQETQYVDEYELNGAQIKDYYEGGKDGILVRSEFTMSDGTTGVEFYDAEGNLTHMTYTMPDGITGEDSFYPNGTLSKSIVRYPEGGYGEWHFADNGYFDEETQISYAGTQTYCIEVAADGTVVFEMASDLQLEEDGSYWETTTFEDGSIQESHYSADGILMGDKFTDPNTGIYSETDYSETGVVLRTLYDDPANSIRSETEYYPNGIPMKMTVTHTNSEAWSTTEYYENGYLKYEYHLGEDGTSNEDKYNEAGYVVYSHNINLVGDYEYFGDDEGNLLKYIENGTVYEGSAISSWVIDGFNMMQEFAQERNAQMQSQHQPQ